VISILKMPGLAVCEWLKPIYPCNDPCNKPRIFLHFRAFSRIFAHFGAFSPFDRKAQKTPVNR